MEASQINYVTCRCQHCNGGIEFEVSDFAKGETRTIECPHCHLETIIFAPTSKIPPLSSTNKIAPRAKKTASPLTVIVLWAITAIFFIIGGACDSSFAILLFYLCFIAAVIATVKIRKKINPSKPNWICAHCGTLLVWERKSRPDKNDICSQCGTNLVVPLGTPRGEELFATYHGTVTAKERVEIGDEATKKLLRSLEPIPASGSLALELEKLAGLVRTGAISTDEWKHAKALYLGQPEASRENSLGRVQQLYDLCQSGALSESEFNMVKWDILSRGMK
jgi:hypothetical protein